MSWTFFVAENWLMVSCNSNCWCKVCLLILCFSYLSRFSLRKSANTVLHNVVGSCSSVQCSCVFDDENTMRDTNSQAVPSPSSMIRNSFIQLHVIISTEASALKHVYTSIIHQFIHSFCICWFRFFTSCNLFVRPFVWLITWRSGV